MLNDITILMVEDDHGHANLIRKHINRSGITNEILHFEDGLEVMDFLKLNGNGLKREPGKAYLLLLDIRMPKLDGIEVLRRIKEDNKLEVIPVIMLTTTDNPETIEQCYKLGCQQYVVKPTGHSEFVKIISDLGEFLQTIEMPSICR